MGVKMSLLWIEDFNNEDVENGHYECSLCGEEWPMECKCGHEKPIQTKIKNLDTVLDELFNQVHGSKRNERIK